MLSEPVQRLRQSFHGAIFLGNVLAGRSRRKEHADCNFSFIAQICKGYSYFKIDRFRSFFRIVFVHQTAWRIDFEINDPVSIIPAVRPVHHESPSATGSHVHFFGGRCEAAWAPPIPDVLRVGIHRENELSRRSEYASCDDFGGARYASFCGHAFFPFFSTQPNFNQGNQNFFPKTWVVAPPSRPLPPKPCPLVGK